MEYGLLVQVDVGNFLRFKSCVLYTELDNPGRPLINVEVEAHVTQPELRISEVSIYCVSSYVYFVNKHISICTTQMYIAKANVPSTTRICYVHIVDNTTILLGAQNLYCDYFVSTCKRKL